MNLGVTRKSVDYGSQSNNMGYVELILINFLIDKFRVPKKKFYEEHEVKAQLVQKIGKSPIFQSGQSVLTK